VISSSGSGDGEDGGGTYSSSESLSESAQRIPDIISCLFAVLNFFTVVLSKDYYPNNNKIDWWVGGGDDVSLSLSLSLLR
jgi:hypothetical protein